MLMIRLAAFSDAPTLVSFNAAMALETEELHLDPAILAHGVAAVLNDSSKGIYFVAEVEGRVVGQLMVTYEWSDWRNGNIWWLQSVYVAPAHRRRGIFTALYRHAQAQARDAGAVALRLYVERDNAGAQETYRRCGMALSHYLVMDQPIHPRPVV
jgi:GNAT superfamily N-acetyltransferase